MQITINNPANVEMTDKETIKMATALADRIGDLEKAVTASQPNITFAPVIQPSEVVNQNNIEVQPTPLEVINQNNIQPAPVENVINVQPAEVKLPRAKREKQKVKRGKNGLIESTDTTIEYEE